MSVMSGSTNVNRFEFIVEWLQKKHPSNRDSNLPSIASGIECNKPRLRLPLKSSNKICSAADTVIETQTKFKFVLINSWRGSLVVN